ncbi:helix-turn-helix domain-containing protein [Nonomuraea ceibae]|uniref:helix-turn-helix domain-containing protein n=1 Tax=Nonomuraea ceibae TaxID=1935170 RepID=UPI001C5FEC46|nr:helix-turn-helix transcriptional regulator [Nonomuraea ceibae]
MDPSLSPVHCLGAGLRLLRGNRSLEDVAAAARVDYSNLSRWERGDRLAPPEPLADIDRALGAGGFLIELRNLVHSFGQMTEVSGETDIWHAEDVDRVRRQILASLTALGASATMLPPLETLRNFIDGRNGSARLQDWEEIVHEHACAFDTVPLPQLISDIALDVLELRRIMPTHGDSRRWHRVNAQLTFLLAHALGSGGQARESRDWWLTARHAAEQSEDPRLIAFARAKAAVQGIYEQRLPLQVLLNRAEDAVDAARGQPCAGLAVAIAIQAQARAMLGDSEGARQALHEQDRVFKLIPKDVTDDTTSAFGWPESRLLHTRSFAATYGGGLTNAAQAQQEALDACPPAAARTRAQIGLHMAVTEVRHGDVVTGLDMARTAVASLPAHDQTTFVRYNAEAVLKAIPPSAPASARSAALDYKQLLELPQAPEQEA